MRQYVQLMGRGVVGVAAKDGKFLWGYNRVANGTANIPTPLVHGDYVFCSSGYQTGAALLEARRPTTAASKADEVYFLDGKEFQNHHGGMILLGDYIYAGHGHNAGAPTCLEWKTGKTVWRHNRGPGTGSAAVAYADGNLYFRFENGVMALIGATPQEYQEKGHVQDSRRRTAQLVAPGDRRRQAVSARARCAVVLRRQASKRQRTSPLVRSMRYKCVSVRRYERLPATAGEAMKRPVELVDGQLLDTSCPAQRRSCGRLRRSNRCARRRRSARPKSCRPSRCR